MLSARDMHGVAELSDACGQAVTWWQNRGLVWEFDVSPHGGCTHSWSSLSPSSVQLFATVSRCEEVLECHFVCPVFTLCLGTKHPHTAKGLPVHDVSINRSSFNGSRKHWIVHLNESRHISRDRPEYGYEYDHSFSQLPVHKALTFPWATVRGPRLLPGWRRKLAQCIKKSSRCFVQTSSRLEWSGPASVLKRRCCSLKMSVPWENWCGWYVVVEVQLSIRWERMSSVSSSSSSCFLSSLVSSSCGRALLVAWSLSWW